MFVVIPAVVQLDPELPRSAKMLYGIITWKCNNYAFTWATNRELGEALDVSPKRASALLAMLEQRGHIETEIRYKDGTKEILHRRIYPIMKSARSLEGPDPIPENKDTPPSQCGDLSSGIGRPLPQNAEVICNINKNKKNTPYSPPAGGTSVGDPAAVPDKPRPQRPRFTPPDVDQVRAYCRERGNSIDPEAFVDFYASKGWTVGRSPMRDWKAAVRTWEQRRKAERKEADDEDDWFQ